MQIGAIGYPTFVYNTNYVNASSLGRVNAVPDDALAGKVGYESSAENINPLRPGASKDLVGILASQMAMSRLNATRIMREPVAEEMVGGADKVQADQNMMDVPDMTDVQDMMADMPEGI